MQAPIDRDEFLQYYDQYAEPLYRYCFYRIYNADDARDLVQDVFMRAWRATRTGDRIENMKAFLYRIAINAIANHCKKKRPQSLEELQEAGFDPVSPVLSIEDRLDAEKVISVLDRIGGPYQEVLILRYINDLEPHEIAEMTGESANVISVRLHRAIDKVKKIIYEQS